MSVLVPSRQCKKRAPLAVFTISISNLLFLPHKSALWRSKQVIAPVVPLEQDVDEVARRKGGVASGGVTAVAEDVGRFTDFLNCQHTLQC